MQKRPLNLIINEQREVHSKHTTKNGSEKFTPFIITCRGPLILIYKSLNEKAALGITFTLYCDEHFAVICDYSKKWPEMKNNM